MAKTLEEKIELAKKALEQKEIRLNELLEKKKELELQTRTDRQSKRGELLESLLPDTINLTDEQFKTFLEKTVANDFGRRILATLTTKTTSAVEVKTPKSAKQNATNVPPVSEGGDVGTDNSAAQAS